jgi:hypothetical protein
VAAANSSLSELPWPPKTGTGLEQRYKVHSKYWVCAKTVPFFPILPGELKGQCNQPYYRLCCIPPQKLLSSKV